MRIAQICPYSLSVPGGVQAQVLGLAEALRRLGHEARVLAPCDGPPPSAMVQPLGKSVPTATNGSIAPIAPDPSCALRTIHALRNERFDVLHLHEPLVPGPTLTALLSSDTPKVGTFHAAGTQTSYANLRFLARPAARRLTRRVAVSEDARHTAERALGGTYDVLFNGIDIARYREQPKGTTDLPVIFFVGRHEPRKGLTVLLDAIEFLHTDVEVWVAGEGPQTQRLRQIHSHDRIRWLGRVTESEKIACFRLASVFCAPSLGGESFGLVLLEAMAAETPIVASQLPGYANVARQGSDAVLVPAGEPRQLATAIDEVLTDAALATSLVAHGTQRAEQFSMDRLAERYVEHYKAAQPLHQV